jgi:hypothetical protein
MKYTKLCWKTCAVLTVLLALYQTAAQEPTTMPPEHWDPTTDALQEPSTMPPELPPTTMDVESSSTTRRIPLGFNLKRCENRYFTRKACGKIIQYCIAKLCKKRSKKEACKDLRKKSRKLAKTKGHHKKCHY